MMISELTTTQNRKVHPQNESQAFLFWQCSPMLYFSDEKGHDAQLLSASIDGNVALQEY